MALMLLLALFACRNDKDLTDSGCVASTWFADADGDGFGDEGASTEACEAPSGTVELGGDCNDADPLQYPGATEEDCTDPIDWNCDGSVGYADADGDGWPACEDCDDSVSAISPDALEVCDGADNDCDGDVDEEDAADAPTWYADADLDGYGDPDSSTASCDQPPGHSEDGSDCDDEEGTTNPGADEVCDGVDNNCDGTVDEESAVDAPTWYADADGDGYGDAEHPTIACDQPSDTVADDSDCDDADDGVYPGTSETTGDEVDSDCDGQEICYADADDDGYSSGTVVSSDEDCQDSGEATTESADVDCDDTDSAINPDATEVCNGSDDDCDGNTDDLGPSVLYGGSTSTGTEQHYQYSSVVGGSGELEANWAAEPGADTYELAVGTSSGATDVLTWTDVGGVSSTTLTGLSLDGAWEGAEYFLSIRSVSGTTSCASVASSNAVQVAEAQTWTGDVADLRDPDDYGGYTEDWPETGVDAIYGEHFFEEVDIGSSTTVMVQGWGAEDGVTAGIASTDAAVTDPTDGWLALYANDITVAGVITASGRGYGGGGGGGAGVRGGVQGLGGDGGLGGAGGPAATGYAGGGGGGSPGGAGGVGATTGGAGNLYGGGSGGTGCGGSNGRPGGDGSIGSVGGTGGTASSGSPGVAGVGELLAGGGTGVSGCDNWSGGGGGGYGAGGGGGSQWAGSTQEASGGGAGGSGGSGGSTTVNGADGAGPYAGTGGVGGGSTGVTGTDGGYLAASTNGDTSTDRSLELGSGGGGGSGGYQETGGGGGSAGGGAIALYAYDTLTLDSTGYVLANGAGGGGGARDNGGSSTSATGGVGAGGGLLLEAQTLTINASCPNLSVTGGDGQTSNGGTIKLFYDSLSGTAPTTCAGRVYDAGTSSWSAP